MFHLSPTPLLPRLPFFSSLSHSVTVCQLRHYQNLRWLRIYSHAPQERAKLYTQDDNGGWVAKPVGKIRVNVDKNTKKARMRTS